MFTPFLQNINHKNNKNEEKEIFAQFFIWMENKVLFLLYIILVRSQNDV